MKRNVLVFAARRALISFSPRTKTIPRRLHITLWQTHSWIKKIVMLRKHSDTLKETQTTRQRRK